LSGERGDKGQKWVEREREVLEGEGWMGGGWVQVGKGSAGRRKVPQGANPRGH
jgi:hypothetical protein